MEGSSKGTTKRAGRGRHVTNNAYMLCYARVEPAELEANEGEGGAEAETTKADSGKGKTNGDATGVDAEEGEEEEEGEGNVQAEPEPEPLMPDFTQDRPLVCLAAVRFCVRLSLRKLHSVRLL